MTTHLLIMYSLALCSLRAPPRPLLESLLFEAPMVGLAIFIFFVELIMVGLSFVIRYVGVKGGSFEVELCCE